MKNEAQGPRKFFVYKITNLKNLKFYIGKTSGENPENRFESHKNNSRRGSKDCPKLYNSIRKHGIENFKFEIISEFETENEAYEREEELIDITDNIYYGLNAKPGGFGYRSGKDHPSYGKSYSAGEKNGMYGKTGPLNPFWGKDHSPNFVLSIKKRNRVLSDKQVINIKKMIVDKVGYKEISKKFNIGMPTIHRIKNGERYADIGPKLELGRYNQPISNDQLEEMLLLWKSNPQILNGRNETNEFYTTNIKNKYNISRKTFKDFVNNKTFKHIYSKVYAQTT
jgi:group I intron endonuclease